MKYTYDREALRQAERKVSDLWAEYQKAVRAGDDEKRAWAFEAHQEAFSAYMTMLRHCMNI